MNLVNILNNHANQASESKINKSPPAAAHDVKYDNIRSIKFSHDVENSPENTSSPDKQEHDYNNNRVSNINQQNLNNEKSHPDIVRDSLKPEYINSKGYKQNLLKKTH